VDVKLKSEMFYWIYIGILFVYYGKHWN